MVLWCIRNGLKMKIVVTIKSPDGSYDEVGMQNRAIFTHYKTLQGAIKYGALRFAKGKPFRLEVLDEANVFGKSKQVIFCNEQGIIKHVTKRMGVK